MRRPTPYAVSFGSASTIRALTPRKEDRPIDDGNKKRERPPLRAGLDLADKYSYLFLLDTKGGAKMIEEGRVRTTPQEL